jgi:hypothetical protein
VNEVPYYQRLYGDVLKLDSPIFAHEFTGIVEYFEGHRPRFNTHIAMYNKFLDNEPINLVYDLGTGVPFTSYYFNLTQGAEVIFGMLEDVNYKVNDKVRSMQINLCVDRPALPPADLVICTECLEHLPCNLYKVREYLKTLVKPGKYMLLSFPCGGQRAEDYWRDFLGDYDKSVTSHYREFTEASAKEFYYGTGWNVLAEMGSQQSHYQATIMNVLLKRPA